MKKQKAHRKPSIIKILIEDTKNFTRTLFSGQMKRPIYRDFRELQEFYLTQEQRNRLSSMSKWRRWLPSGFLLIKAMILKLNPIRRVLLMLGIFFILRSNNGNINFPILGSAILLFILMVE